MRDGLTQVVVYRVTGKQLFFTVPDRICEECDLTVAAVRRVMEAQGGEEAGLRLTIKAWLEALPEALWRGGWHPPVVTINGKVVSQGVVPDRGLLEEAIQAARQATSARQ